MDTKEHHLVILNEESIELAQNLLNLTQHLLNNAKIADKAIRFGIDDHHPQEDKTNAEAIIEEFAHVVAGMEQLAKSGMFDNATNMPTLKQLVDKKLHKVEFMMNVSRRAGTLVD